MVSFYPGPSRVYDEIPRYVKDAHKLGILSLNHRSPEFESISKKTVGLLKKKLGIPAAYTVLFAGSATECWEVIAQSLVRGHSIHIHNGAFGEKWFDYTRRLRPDSKSIPFSLEEVPAPGSTTFTSGDVICLTQNETSNGTQLTNEFIQDIQARNPGHLIAVDATSSMAGIRLNFAAADVWFASVQKCFGLPAGLAVMVLSPKASETTYQINERAHYNSLPFMADMMTKWQTPFTPNVLGIYLLMRVLENVPSIAKTHKVIANRSKAWHAFLKKTMGLRSMVENPANRSLTVITVRADAALMLKVKKTAKANGFLLGEGYGALKGETFRIANFPAIKQKEINGLMKVLSRF